MEDPAAVDHQPPLPPPPQQPQQQNAAQKALTSLRSPNQVAPAANAAVVAQEEQQPLEEQDIDDDLAIDEPPQQQLAVQEQEPPPPPQNKTKHSAAFLHPSPPPPKLRRTETGDLIVVEEKKPAPATYLKQDKTATANTDQPNAHALVRFASAVWIIVDISTLTLSYCYLLLYYNMLYLPAFAEPKDQPAIQTPRCFLAGPVRIPRSNFPRTHIVPASSSRTIPPRSADVSSRGTAPARSGVNASSHPRVRYFSKSTCTWRFAWNTVFDVTFLSTEERFVFQKKVGS